MAVPFDIKSTLQQGKDCFDMLLSHGDIRAGLFIRLFFLTLHPDPELSPLHILWDFLCLWLPMSLFCLLINIFARSLYLLLIYAHGCS